MAKTPNVGIFLPHPHALRYTAEAIRVCHDAGVITGAPEHWVQMRCPQRWQESDIGTFQCYYEKKTR